MRSVTALPVPVEINTLPAVRFKVAAGYREEKSGGCYCKAPVYLT
jgi:hypothetical protein